jgi:hypothetical protein
MPKIKSARIHLKLSATELELRGDLLEFFYTNHLWPGAEAEEGEVFIKGNQFKALPEQRETIQSAGETYGCHTCLTKIAADRNQPWTGDHNPPTKLTLSVKKDLFEDWDGKKTSLLAQCDKCSTRQASLVKDLNVQEKPSKYLKSLSEVERKIILGGREGEIIASGASVTPPQGLAIQKEGIAVGCHSCDSRIPSHTYHADHLPPAELLTNYMPRVCKKLLMYDEVGDFLENPRLRPQCKRCSGKQGGDLKGVAKRAQDYARFAGITVYK